MSNQNSSFYALLIGVNYYFPNRLSNGSSYKSLKGCVRDINQVEDFLNQLATGPNKIVKLTASNPENNEPVEPPEQLPTYENIVKSFQYITQIANPGDRIYIHYFTAKLGNFFCFTRNSRTGDGYKTSFSLSS
ncbi:MAG: hypothetical protein VKK42_25425 [Lyngbya sp.]|nr:hypothetical protein [Lyngbya sp.]